ncbi:hypothetical protein BC826DRAFT_91624 [Russula brevipes]|nr:hypothetical protein BC826DRAFT_91624 [Russula brevipes]
MIFPFYFTSLAVLHHFLTLRVLYSHGDTQYYSTSITSNPSKLVGSRSRSGSVHRGPQVWPNDHDLCFVPKSVDFCWHWFYVCLCRGQLGRAVQGSRSPLAIVRWCEYCVSYLTNLSRSRLCADTRLFLPKNRSSVITRSGGRTVQRDVGGSQVQLSGVRSALGPGRGFVLESWRKEHCVCTNLRIYVRG